MSINALKILALICMVFDHIGEFFLNSPIWFRWIGRLSAPLFFYCSAWGFYYTKNRKRYLFRLYFLGIVMSIGNIIIFLVLKKANGINNNIFVTLFLGCVIVDLIERKSTNKEKIRGITCFTLHQIIIFTLCVALAEFLEIPWFIGMNMRYYLYGALFGSVIFCEGSICFVLFFVIVYFLKKKKKELCVFFSLFSFILEFLIRRAYYMRGAIEYLVPFNKFQWMMVFVLPLFLMYNGKEGRKCKWFYYLFYPMHIWILYAIANL